MAGPPAAGKVTYLKSRSHLVQYPSCQSRLGWRRHRFCGLPLEASGCHVSCLLQWATSFCLYCHYFHCISIIVPTIFSAELALLGFAFPCPWCQKTNHHPGTICSVSIGVSIPLSWQVAPIPDRVGPAVRVPAEVSRHRAAEVAGDHQVIGDPPRPGEKSTCSYCMRTTAARRCRVGHLQGSFRLPVQQSCQPGLAHGSDLPPVTVVHCGLQMKDSLINLQNGIGSRDYQSEPDEKRKRFH